MLTIAGGGDKKSKDRKSVSPNLVKPIDTQKTLAAESNISHGSLNSIEQVIQAGVAKRNKKEGSPNLVNLLDTQKTLAAEAEISHGTLNSIEQTLKSGDAELIALARKGAVSVSAAAKVAKLAPEKRAVVVERVGRGERASDALKSIKSQELQNKKTELAEVSKKTVADNRPVITVCSYADHAMQDCDLLITDPPYSTDVDDIYLFASEWLSHVLPSVKPTGRAYICIGAYPAELNAYLSILLNDYKHFIVDNPIIWTYRNTLGVTPKEKYNLNYQVILHLRQKDTPALDTSITNEMFSVQDINAPDGRQGNRYHAWQKPDELAMRLVRHGSKEGGIVYDPFSCTGAFLLAAAKQGRKAYGCEINAENAKIAESRGCHVIY